MYVYVLVHVYVNYARCQNMFSDCSPYISVWVMGAGMMLMMCLLGARPTGPCADPPVEGRDHQRLPPVGRDHGQHAQEGAQQVRRRHPHTEQWRRWQWRWWRAAGDGAPSAYHEWSALTLDTETQKSRQGRLVRTVAPLPRPCAATTTGLRTYVRARVRASLCVYAYTCVSCLLLLLLRQHARLSWPLGSAHPLPTRSAFAQSVTSNATAPSTFTVPVAGRSRESSCRVETNNDVIVAWNEI